jgi:pimeloyl-ACP methyl ester carboxylesterase
VVWLHGGPHEDVSPRFNPFWSALLALGHAVYALDYPGSTGAGNAYELRGVPADAALRRQVEAVEREIGRLSALGLGEPPLVLVGVSYGSLIAHEIALGGRVRVAKLVDLSGIAGARLAPAYRTAAGPLPKILFVHGDRDPFLVTAGRRALFAACEEKTGASRVEVAREGHVIKKRASLAKVVEALRAFLGP